jgi:uncharacterized protein with HEPN domain
MSTAKDERVYLYHIVQEMDALLEYAEDTPYDGKTQRAICRCYGVIGEAANKLSTSFRENYSEFPWRKMVDMRNLVVHGYDGVSNERLEQVAREHVAPIYAPLKTLFETLDQEE